EINWKYKSGAWYPIVLVNKRIDYLAQISYYRAADLCLVGSLHDGMNLVAKEYIMANTDNRGMLVLSQFTGSARELKDAVLVNPYDLDGFARGIRRAIEMSPQKKREKLKKMKEVIGENNIYYWAGQFINELVKL
ncbi:MAG: trehalose-6-phosphate synthase, partial [Planctomycetes bacterium]|nr:trehalose-6-phosphate synthase [Planctomycetota bacterium]